MHITSIWRFTTRMNHGPAHSAGENKIHGIKVLKFAELLNDSSRHLRHLAAARRGCPWRMGGRMWPTQPPAGQMPPTRTVCCCCGCRSRCRSMWHCDALCWLHLSLAYGPTHTFTSVFWQTYFDLVLFKQCGSCIKLQCNLRLEIADLKAHLNRTWSRLKSSVPNLILML